MIEGGQNFELMSRMVIPVRREHRVVWADGIPSGIDVKEFEIDGIVLPITGRELLLVPEGDRFRQSVWVYTQDDLQDNDVITHEGRRFEVQVVESWLGQYRRARATKIDVGAEDDVEGESDNEVTPR